MSGFCLEYTQVGCSRSRGFQDYSGVFEGCRIPELSFGFVLIFSIWNHYAERNCVSKRIKKHVFLVAKKVGKKEFWQFYQWSYNLRTTIWRKKILDESVIESLASEKGCQGRWAKKLCKLWFRWLKVLVSENSVKSLACTCANRKSCNTVSQLCLFKTKD